MHIHISVLFQILFPFKLLWTMSSIALLDLAGYLFEIEQCVHVNPKFLIYPPHLSPLVNIVHVL